MISQIKDYNLEKYTILALKSIASTLDFNKAKDLIWKIC